MYQPVRLGVVAFVGSLVMSNRSRLVPSVVMSLTSAASRAVAGMGFNSVFESLEQRTMMAVQPGSSMAYDVAGNLHLAYYDEAAKNLKYMKQSPGGAWTSAVTVDATSSDIGKTPSLAVDGAGRPGVAYFDSANEDLRFAFLDGNAWKNVAVDTRDSVGQNPSLAFDAAGTARISYYRKTTGDLRLATLRNLARNKWTITTVARKGDVGKFSSIAIDPATNKPTVAFSDSAGQVQFSAAGKKPVIVDSVSGDVANLDIAFGNNGRPAISYYDPASGRIKAAEAGDPKARFFTNETLAEVPAGSNASPALIIDPATGRPQIVYYDQESNGVFLAKKNEGGQDVARTQLKAGGGEGFIATPQPGNNSISFAVVDTTGGQSSPVQINNTETTPLPPTNVTAIALSDSEVQLSWVDNATNETGFLIERSGDAVSWTTVGQVGANVTEFVDASADEATTYYYRVSATGGGGETSVGTTAPRVFGSSIVSAGGSTLVAVTTRPKAPSGLAATPVSSSRIDLTWVDNSTSETGYVVLLSTNGQSWEAIAIGANATSHSFTQLTEGTTYLFKVYAARGNSTSQMSPEVEQTTRPASPTGLTVTQISTSQLNLTWSNQATAATAVAIERSTNGTTWTTIATRPPSTTTYNSTGLSEGTAYYFRVRTVGVHSSDYSNVGNGTTNPLAPSNLTATAVSPSRIDLVWSDNTAGETSYLVQRSSGGGSFVTVATLDANASSYADTGRTEGVSYAYRVKAVVGSEAQSAFSAEVSTEPLPSTPTDLTASLAQAGRHVSLAWTDNATGETSYQVERLTFGAGSWDLLATLASNAGSYTDTTPAEATTYTYRVRAINSGGPSAYSGTYIETTVPADPSGLIVATPANDTIQISWTDNSDGETGFRIERSTDGVQFSVLATTDANETFYEDDGLSAATTYTYRVVATNTAGSSGATLAVAGTTRTNAPADVVATNVSDEQVDLDWSAVAGADEYVIERSDDNGQTWDAIGDSETHSYSDLQVEEGTSYRYRVIALNAGGDSEASDDADAVTRPAAPSALVAASTSSSSVSITWSDNSSGETGYVLQRSSDHGLTFSTSFDLDADVDTYTDNAVGEASSYVYRVRAVGVGGTSDWSDTSAVTTRPAAPTGVVATTDSATQITITWEDNSGGESGYRIERSENNGTTWDTVATPAADAETCADTDLDAATLYLYRVVATSAAGDSATSDAVAAVTRTLAPSNFAASTYSEGRIDLAWTAPYGADGFILYRSTDGVNFSPITTLDGSDISHIDSGLTEATDYYYELVATNDGGSSAAAGATNTTQPIAPDGAAALANSATSVTVSWSDNSAGEEACYVEISTDGGNTFTDAGQTFDNVESLNVTVDEGSAAIFRVRAIRSGVYSDYSNTAAVETIPAPPSAVTVTSDSDSELTVGWTDNSANETGFRIERSDDGNSYVEIGAVGAGVTSFADSALDEGSVYHYRVRATMGVARNSDYSDAEAGVTRPAAPTTVNAALVGGGVDLTWNNPSINAESYIVERSSDGGDTWNEIGDSVTTGYSDSTASAGLTYLYRVIAVNEGGRSAASDDTTATLVPGTPTDLTATVQPGGDDVTIAWSDVAGETGYSLYRSDDGGANWSLIVTLPAGDTSHDDPVAENAEYQYRVRAFNGSGESADSAEAIVNTTLIPATNVAAGSTHNSVTVTWDDNSSGEAAYSVQRSANNGATWSQVGTTSADAETFTDNAVAQGTSYRYRVTATNGLVASTPSASVTIVTKLANPTGLAASSPSASRVDLTWTNNASNYLGTQIWKSADGVNFTQVDFVSAGNSTWADTNLNEATTHLYHVRAANSIATSDFTSNVSGLTRPSAPAQVQATVDSDTEITLDWTNTSGGATGFTIEISDDNGVSWATAGTTNGATTFTSTGLTEATTYSYRVSATNASGESATVAATATTHPSAPTGLAATGVSPTQVSLAWSNTSASATTIRIERDDGDGFAELTTVAGSETTYDDTTVVEGTEYSYRVIAVYLSDSLPGNDDTITTAPAAVDDLAANAVSDTEIALTWTDESANETAFRVERSADGVSFSTLAALPAGDTGHTDSTGVEGTTYYYRVVSVQGSLETTSVTTSAQTAPAAPTSLSASSASAGSISLSWTDNSANETEFVIERSSDGVEFDVLATVAADETSYADTVAAGVTYYYRVFAAQGIPGAAASATGVSRPAAAGNVAVDAVAPTTVTLSWDAVSGATGYTIEVSDDAGSNWATAGTTTLATSFEDTGLTESTGYQYRVIATNAGGASVTSSVVDTHTLPFAPSDLTAAAASPTQINLTWTDNSSSGQASILVYRALGELPSQEDFTLLTTLPPGTQSHNDATVQGGIAYTYRLIADDGDAVNGNATDSATTPPSAVTSLNAVSNTPTTVSITWTASNGATSYTVERSTNGVNFTELDEVETNSFTDETAVEATDYTYRVTATGAGGDSPTATDAVSTLPAGVTTVSVGAVTATSVQLNWTDPSNGETGFRIERSLDGENWSILTTVAADAETYTDSTAVEATTYAYRAVPVAAGGDGETAVADVTTLPATATSVVATGVSSTRVDIAWDDNSAGELSYTVLRAAGGAFAVLASGLDADADSYSDTTVEPATAYQYKVVAEGVGGPSAESATASVTTVAPAPANLGASMKSITEVALAWDDVAGNTSFRIERKTGNGAFAEIANGLGADVTSYDDESAVEGASYVYRVFAVNAGGDSAASNEAAVTTAPAAPSGLTATNTSATTIEVTWNDNSAGETSITIERFDGSDWSLLATIDPDTESYNDTVAPGSTYSYRVYASNAGGGSALSGTDSATTVPAQVGGVTALAGGTTSVDVAWTPVSGTTGYRVFRSEDAGLNFALIGNDLGDAADSYTDSSATEATAYVYRVVAFNASGEGAVSANAAAATPPNAPTHLTHTAVSTSGVDLQWTDNSANEAEFQVQHSTDGDETWEDIGTADDVAGAGDNGSLTDNNVVEGATYIYRVRATFGGVASAWSATHSADTEPQAPTALAVTAFTDTTVNLGWSDNSSGEAGYTLQRSTDGGGNWTIIATLDPDTASYEDAGLSQSVEYTYRVRAFRGDSTSGFTSNVVVTTRPAAATGLDATAVNPTTVSLSWTDSASAEDGYRVERTNDGGETWTEIADLAADADSYTDSLAPESAQSGYRVVAYKGSIESTVSNEDFATTPVAAPSALMASATSHNAVSLTWTDNSGVETSQRIERSDDGGSTWSTLASVGPNVTSHSDTTVAEDSEYEYRIIALVGLNESNAGMPDDVTTPLARPTSLAAGSPTATSVALSWTNVSAAAEDVIIERSADAGENWSAVATIDASNAEYTDSTVAEGAAYVYRIHAVRTGNASAMSATAGVVTLPATPTSVDATVFSLDRIDLSWNDNAGSETGYRIERSANGGDYEELATVAADEETYSDTTVHEGGTFAYLVYAVGAGGDSAGGTDTAITAPADPTGFTVTPITATRIDLAWSDNSGGETAYVVERSTDGGGNWSVLATLNPNATSYSDTTVVEASTCHYRVRGERTSAASAWAIGDATTAPAMPTSVNAAVPAGTPRVNLTWTDNSSGENGVEIQRSDDSGANWTTVATAAANATSYSDTSVSEGSTYQFRIRATSAAGNSTWSSTVTAHTLPTTPTGLSATAASYNQINLSWTDNSSRENGFLLERSIGGVSWSAVATLGADVTSYNDTSVAEGFTYQYRVRAMTAAVNGSPSGTASASTPVAAPTNMVATAISTTQVNLTWTDNSAAESNYKIERSTDGGSSFTALATVVANTASYSDTTATAGTTYVYRIRATKSAIVSGWATSSAVTTAPTAPANLSATAASHSDVNLTWTDAQGESVYTIERSANLGATWTTLTTAVGANATNYTDTTATEETTYVYRISATNAAGASETVASNTVTTLPSAPTGVDATTISTDTISITWNDTSATESGFRIERQVELSNNWIEIATVAGNVTEYIDPTGDESVAYEYRVRATSGPRNSAYSNTAVASTLPFAPTDLVVTAATGDSVSLQWTNPSAAPTLMIERSTDGGDTFTAIDTVGQGETEYTNSGLPADTTYVYRIRAYNGDGGFSDPTNTVLVTTEAA